MESLQALLKSDVEETGELFAEPDSSEIYTRVELIAHSWEDGTEAHIASMTFAEPYSF